MRHAWTIAAKDLRRRVRDRTAILVALVLPFGLAWIFSLTLGDIETRGLDVTYAVVNGDAEGDLPHALTEVLEGLDFVTLEEAASAQEAERLAEDGDLDAAVVFPEGFSAGVESGQGGRVRVIGAPDSDIGALILVSIVRSFGAELDAIGLSVAVAGGEADPERIARAQEVPPAAVIRSVESADR
ncbi:MAG TPA: ABC transporter permease, partial [Actinomycetota bacterium]